MSFTTRPHDRHAAPRHRWLRLAWCAAVFAAGAPCAVAQSGIGAAYVNNFAAYQKNADGSAQWMYEPRIYVPYRFEEGWTFTQRIDLPLVYTNAAGPGNPGGGWSGGIGDILVQESFTSPEIAPNLQANVNLRFLFPTGKQVPFGSSQYQWALGGGLIYQLPDTWHGVTLAPSARYYWGFDPQYPDVSEIRELDLYPGATFALPERWSLQLYPENPITYSQQSKSWFIPFDFMLTHKIDSTFDFGIGGAYKLGNPSNAPFRYVIDARLIVSF
jgi:hypothetical protein